jgi:hypothetical protein
MDHGSHVDQAAMQERRAPPRPLLESRASGLIQAILRDTHQVAVDLERDLRAGADAMSVIALLEAADTLSKLRGVDLRANVAIVRRHLRRAGLAP